MCFFLPFPIKWNFFPLFLIGDVQPVLRTKCGYDLEVPIPCFLIPCLAPNHP